jgi:hypothetical protein
MTVPVLSQEQFLEFLKSNGCKIVSDEYWNDYDTLVIEKDGINFTLKLEDKYFYPIVVAKCRDLGIDAPKDHLHSFYQHFTPNEPCYCNGLKPFNECHGKVH